MAPERWPWEIGRAWLEVDDFTGRDDFVDALRTGVVHGRLVGHAIHFQTRYDKLRRGWPAVPGNDPVQRRGR